MTLAIVTILQVARADVTTYTDESLYNAALTARAVTNVTFENFDSTAAGTLIPNNSSLGAFTFTGLPGGAGVDNAFTTTSPSNYLGIPTGGTFTSGGFTFSFASSNAFAMKIITSNKPPTLSNDDFTLMGGGTSVNLNTADAVLVAGFPPFSSEAYFFGIINTDAAFTSVTFNKNNADMLNYFVDDLQIGSVPEPNSIGLLALTLLPLVGRRGRRST
jgi:hypothetical protein